MIRNDALRMLEQMLELPAETLRGPERLGTDVPWDSLSTVIFMGHVDKRFKLPVPGSQVANCKTVEELLRTIEVAQAKRAA